MKKNYVFENGKWWYVGCADGNRRTAESHERKNTTRMFVDGKYIPKKHPMHKPGNYESFEAAWNHNELDKQTVGYVYAIMNPAWPEWIKIGMAVDANDRLKSYQTSSPHRDYELKAQVYTLNKRKAESTAHTLCSRVCDERAGEWFKMPLETAVTILTELQEQEELPLSVAS